MSFQDLKPALQDWSDRFGYYMAKDVDYRKPIEKVARYVSKYACKGVFENPFCCSPKPSEEFSAFLKRLRRELHIPYACFPFVFILSSWNDSSEGFSPERAVSLCGWLFGRNIESEVRSS